MSLACASSKELARRAEVALQRHDYDRAYREARAALDKDFGNARAREALSAAAEVLIRRQQEGVLEAAEYDTIGAADRLLDLRAFVDEVRRYDAELPVDPEFDDAARRIRLGAAGLLYSSGRTYEAEGKFRQAYRSYESAQRFAPGHEDLGTRMPAVYERALIRIAIVPFLDETHLPRLSRELAEQMYADMAPRIAKTQFTQVILRERVYAGMEPGDAGSISRVEALEVGRAAGATVVVWGRLRGLRTDQRTDHYHGHIYRKTSYRDTSGRSVDRYHEVPFEAKHRRRDVWLRWDYEAIDVAEGKVLMREGDEARAWVRTVYSDIAFEGDTDDYFLYPPDWRDRDRPRCDALDRGWSETFGRWSVPKFLEHAEDHRGRRHYEPRYRDEFRRSEDPFYLDDLPSTDDLALVALDGVPKRLLTGLLSLEDP
jgi:tetratricopeptide (TPR) repeat protein